MQYETNTPKHSRRTTNAKGQNKMEDEQILKQILYGNHLDERELERALKLSKLIDIDLKARIRRFSRESAI